MRKDGQRDVAWIYDFVFEILGNTLGDQLILIELKAIEYREDKFYIEKVKAVLNKYAVQFDVVLNSYKREMKNDIERLTNDLLIELNKLTDPELKH